MTKIIAFSGNSNTGKTTAIHYLKERYAQLHPELEVEILHETAREYIDAHGGGAIEDVHDFETFIIQQETERLHQLEQIKKEGKIDLVFIDRTGLDAVIYSYWNLINDNICRIDYVQNYFPILDKGREIYDKVIFFTTPIKIDSRFPIYNNEHINAVFEHSIKFFYKEKVIMYTNNIFFQDNVESTIFGNIFDM